jgi:hypothetical protein
MRENQNGAWETLVVMFTISCTAAAAEIAHFAYGYIYA